MSILEKRTLGDTGGLTMSILEKRTPSVQVSIEEATRQAIIAAMKLMGGRK